LSVRWHLEVEAGHEHDQLLSVDHAPKHIQRGRHQQLKDEISKYKTFRCCLCIG
jgi:hypothetical protein